MNNWWIIPLRSGSTKSWCWIDSLKQFRWFTLKYPFGLHIKGLIKLKNFLCNCLELRGPLQPLPPPPWLRPYLYLNFIAADVRPWRWWSEKQIASILINSYSFGATSDCHKLIPSDCRETQSMSPHTTPSGFSEHLCRCKESGALWICK